MADKKISDLTAITGANTADDDLLVIVDTSAGETKRITLGELENGLARSNFALGDNEKITFGAGSDLQIYHDGSNSWINEVGTGSLIIGAESQLVLGSPSLSEYYVNALKDGAVIIYYDNAVKLSTTSSGIDVTGTVTADGADIQGVIENSTSGQTVGQYLYRSGAVNGGFGLNFDGTNVDDLTRSSWAITPNVAVGEASTILDITSRSPGDAAGAGKSRFRIANAGDISFYEDTGTTPKFFWDASAESLGIGNTSPIAALDVTGTDSTGSLTSLGDTVTRAAAVIRGSTHANGYGLYMGYGNSTTDAQYIQATRSSGTAGFPLLLNPYGGNVGIGTTLCGAPLSFADSAALKIQFNGNAANYYGISKLAASGGGDGDLTFTAGQTSAGNFTFDSGGAERMRINSSGLVGIGTSSPTEKLEVSGSINTTYQSASFTYGSKRGFFDCYAAGNIVRFGALSGGSTDGMDLAFYTTSSGALGGTERMRIDSSGNLLVGRTTSSGFVANSVALSSTSGAASIFDNTSNIVAFFNRRTTDGTILTFNKDGSTVGGIGARSGALCINYSSRAGLSGTTGYDAILPGDGSGGIVGNSIDLGISAYRFKDLYLSGGVYLGGTGSANHLDDYEEGTWTPVARGRTSSGTGTYTRQAGYYTKVGKLVTANFDIGWSAHTGTGGLEISLPFTVSGTGYQGGAYLTYNSGLSYSYNMIHGWMDNGGSYVRIWQTNTSGASSNVPMDTSVSELHFTVVYTATD